MTRLPAGSPRPEPAAPQGHGATAPRLRTLAPLYASGFTSAFGAHSIAAGLGVEAGGLGMDLLAFGVILALYDVAEVVLKPLFGTLADRIGAKPVVVGGLLVFALASALGFAAQTPLALGLARLAQGAAASAFSPASSAAVARLAGPAAAGRYFGRYGSWKGLGYVFGPLLGAGLISMGGFPALFAALLVLSSGVALWAWTAMPDLPILPRPRYTVLDVLRQSKQRTFMVPTMALAGATAALGAAVGFLPLVGAGLGLPVFASMAAVTVLALGASLTQPLAGRWRDSGLLPTHAGMGAGLLLAAAGLAVAGLVPSPVALFAAAALGGVGIGIATPLGFAHLAATTPEDRLGRTMGSAELGREAGDAGGPLLVGAVAAAAGVGTGLGVLATALALLAAVVWALLRRPA